MNNVVNIKTNFRV
jgi:hypothetical protein